ncbi:MAG: nitroreductase family protein [Raoultibacter sp.]|jgi:hypothetical protein
MSLYDAISQRKSCRRYDMNTLDQEFFFKIEEAIQSFDKLDASPTLEHRFTRKVKGHFKVDAPHYLIVSGQGKPGESENAGFLFQQLMLWFDTQGIGSVWLGSSKDTEVADTKQDIITMAFGKPAEPLHRTIDQFKREPIDSITNAPDDICIQAAHLAPSGMNTQPWYFQKKDEHILLYEKKLKPPVSLAYKLSDIDMGIGLCHYDLACKETNKPFQFLRQTKLPEKAGYKPFGIIG